jgi:hypothetical protein
METTVPFESVASMARLPGLNVMLEIDEGCLSTRVIRSL